MRQPLPYSGTYYLRDYVPSLPAAVSFAVVFGILTIWVVWSCIKTKTTYSIAFAAGGARKCNLFS